MAGQRYINAWAMTNITDAPRKTKEEIYSTASALAICYLYEELADWLNTVISRAQAGVFIADTWQPRTSITKK